MTLTVIVAWIIAGLIIGGLAHLLVPGRQRTGILWTLLVGIAGALIGGFVTAALLGAGHLVITFLVSLVVSAVLISVVAHPRHRRRLTHRRRRLLR